MGSTCELDTCSLLEGSSAFMLRDVVFVEVIIRDEEASSWRSPERLLKGRLVRQYL